jgi:hypothetical protein
MYKTSYPNSLPLPYTAGYASLHGGQFNPASLFAAGEQGAWYDPSDLTTLFQDTAGTTPVTAPGNTVALINDKSGNGNHATQSILASRPTYAVVPATGRRNLLVRTEEFENAAWALGGAGGTVSVNVTQAPNGTTTADKIAYSSGNFTRRRQDATVTLSSQVTFTCYMKQSDWRYGYLLVFDTANRIVYADLELGIITSTSGGATGSILSIGNGWHRVSLTIFAAATLTQCFVGAANAPNRTDWSGAVGAGIFVWGAQLETGSTATAYQRVGSAFDVTEAGMQSLSYLSFDGTDDSMVTSSIDFTATDKMSVFAGVRKLSDAARGIVAELTNSTATNNGAWLLSAPEAASDTFAFASKGTAQATAIATGIAAPATRVLTGVGDIAGDSAIIRVNGTQAAQDTTDQGAGNYANAVLRIGRRGGTSLPFNGQIYGMIIRGAATPLATIQQTETWLSAKTGVTL